MKRKLKIESSEDCARKYRTCKPAVIRLQGQWLAQLGFASGQYVDLAVISPGVLEIRLCRVPSEHYVFGIETMRLGHSPAADEARKKGNP